MVTLMKLYLSVFFVFVGLNLNAKQLSLSVNAESVLLVNANTGAILYEKNAHVSQFPASLTKIATCLYALHKNGENLNMLCTTDRDSIVTISENEQKRSNYTLPAYWLTPDTSHIGLKNGEVMSLIDLLYGVMISSGGDASNVVAQNIGGTVPKFMEEVNEYLVSIGCHNTHYVNPHGLHHPDHMTTAYDLANMTRVAMLNPTFRKIVKTPSYTRPKTNKQEATTLVQTNRLLKKGKFYYSGAIGVKTGYTSPAKHCLVAAAKHDDRTLIAVMLKSPDRDEMFLETKAMFVKAFEEEKVSKIFIQKGPQKHTMALKGASDVVKTYVEEPAIISYYPSEEPQLRSFLTWDCLELPIKMGDRVGEIAIKDDKGAVVKRTILYSQAEVKHTFLAKMLTHPYYLAAGGFGLLVLLAWLFVVRKNRISKPL